jgi:hypothetical protein
MPLTLFLAQLLGVLFIVVGLSMWFQKKLLLDAVQLIIHNRVVVYLMGFVGVVAGLALILAHNLWSAGFLALVITLIGWITLFRGLIALFASQNFLKKILHLIKFEKNYYLIVMFVLILGIYLSYAGFTG